MHAYYRLMSLHCDLLSKRISWVYYEILIVLASVTDRLEIDTEDIEI